MSSNSCLFKLVFIFCPNSEQIMRGDKVFTQIYSLTIYPFTPFGPMFPIHLSLISRVGGGAGPDKRLQTVASFSLCLDFVLTLSKF